ncbi:GfdT protein [Pikeienuella piscinae]|uniref:GfdT protein n=1 Tax=Pikeienuella piscinae TaxID=2748098 RepID=A0A7L5C1U2_9RHOB|nr:FIST N-terminal domain-containing protein [Pikeienuella piscinae]QIE55829.1 GfdT protein [Pikeienuella piscinae]
MDGTRAPASGAAAAAVRKAHARSADPDAAVAAIRAGLGVGQFALIALFVSHEGDFARISAGVRAACPEAALIGCTTAGEISPAGYASGEVVALGFPASAFAAELLTIDDVNSIDQQAVGMSAIRARAALADARPDWRRDCAFLLVDGLSMKEEDVAAALSTALGPTPLFGGSAGDGLAFRETRVMANGDVRCNAAVVALIRTRCPIHTFRLDHHRPTVIRMVVTAADPARRLVREINAEPAAREYARILGQDPEQLSPFIFAANPVLVRIGGQHHVRAIREVAPNGDLVFFSAIDEGLVLTLADPDDIALHLEREMKALAEPAAPSLVLACDCLLRRVEAEQKQATAAVSRLLAAHNVIGFNTYGEQFNGAHVNQTMTGLAIYPPED